MVKLEFGGKYYDIIDDLNITTASNEVMFDNVTIDFNEHTIDELPTKYQEIRIVEIEKISYPYYVDKYKTFAGDDEYPESSHHPLDVEEKRMEYEVTNVIYNGFLESYKINERKNDWDDVELELTLLTPMKMATVRYVSIYGEYFLENLINEVLKPLIRDGFRLRRVEVPVRRYKANWTLKTVENAMNILCNTYNLWWFIDETKNIYIYDIETLLAKDPITTMTEDNKFKGLYSFVPELNVDQYANQVSIKNARVVRRAEGCGVGSNAYPRLFFDRLKSFTKDEEYEFDNPIVFYKPGQFSSNQILFRLFTNKYAIYVTGMESDGTIKGHYYTNPVYSKSSDGVITITSYTKRVDNKGMAVQSDGSDTEDEDNYIILFTRDAFFSNLITGFKFKGVNSNISYPEASPFTETALVYEVYTVRDRAEIMKKKGIISDSGIVEEVIDAYDKWFKEDEIHEFAIKQLEMLKGSGTKVILRTDEKPSIKIGDLIRVDWKKFFAYDNYICYKISQRIIKTDVLDEREWTVELINAEMNSTFIDLFRPHDEEEDENRVVYHVTGIYGSEHVEESATILKDGVV